MKVPVYHVQDYLYEVLDCDTVPGGRSIWIIDMKGELSAHAAAMQVSDGSQGHRLAHLASRPKSRLKLALFLAASPLCPLAFVGAMMTS